MKKKGLREQVGAAGATTSATFQPATGSGGSPSKSGAFPGSALRKKKKEENVVRRPFPNLNETPKTKKSIFKPMAGKELKSAEKESTKKRMSFDASVDFLYGNMGYIRIDKIPQGSEFAAISGNDPDEIEFYSKEGLISMAMNLKRDFGNDEDEDVDEAYTELKPVTKHQGTVVFNKGDIDSVANPKNFPVVKYKGINKKWGMSENINEAINFYNKVKSSSVKEKNKNK